MINQQPSDTAVTIDTIFADTWLTVCQLRHGTQINNGQEFYRRACEQIDNSRQLLTEKGYSASTIENMLYAQCALLDESVMNRRDIRDDGYTHWLQSPLQARYFNTLEAGSKLWDRIQNVLQESAPNPDLLILFHRVLTLGFMGKFTQPDDEQREQIVKLLTARVPTYALSSSLPRVIRPQKLFSRRRLYWMGWIGGIVILAGLWWGLSHSLDQLLQQLLNQG